MISKLFRFTKALFEKKFRRSQRFKMGEFEFLVSEDSSPHIACVVGKKITKLATKRNRIRRQLYECMRTNLLPFLGNKNVICIYHGKEILENTKYFEQNLKKLLQSFGQESQSGNKR